MVVSSGVNGLVIISPLKFDIVQQTVSHWEGHMVRLTKTCFPPVILSHTCLYFQLRQNVSSRQWILFTLEHVACLY